ncbi:MAG TPA: hypothetical protein ENN03_02060 [bacterium]|nr:hypothetical protein [bacterium]
MREYHQKEKLELLDRVMWDCPVPAPELLKLLDGKIDGVYHLTRRTLVRRLIESYPWFVISALIPPRELIPMLDRDFLESLRFPSLKRRYAFIKSRLQDDLPAAG